MAYGLFGLGERLDRVAGFVDDRLLDEHLQRCVLECRLVVFDRRLEARVDTGGGEQLLQLLTLGHVAGHGDLHEVRHDSTDPSAGARPARAPERTSSGSPRSGNGITTTSKSRGTTVEGKTCVASSTT